MLRYFFKTLVPKLETRWEVLRLHFFPFIFIATFIMLMYFVSAHVASGWLTYIASSIILAMIGLTVLARLNDIPYEESSTRWQARRLGLILVMMATIGLVLAPWVSQAHWPTWREVIFRLGVLLVWMTTPGMPPWFYYISGEYRNQEPKQ